VKRSLGLAVSAVSSHTAEAGVELSLGLAVSAVGSRAAVAGVERSSGLAVSAVSSRTAAAGMKFGASCLGCQFPHGGKGVERSTGLAARLGCRFPRGGSGRGTQFGASSQPRLSVPARRLQVWNAVRGYLPRLSVCHIYLKYDELTTETAKLNRAH
jgi:hypothetical protein